MYNFQVAICPERNFDELNVDLLIKCHLKQWVIQEIALPLCCMQIEHVLKQYVSSTQNFIEHMNCI